MSGSSQGSRAGSQFGRYYLKRLLGRGGMGEVYEAEDTVKERLVALKVLSAALCQDPVFRERLQREARTAGRLNEPHVVPVHDYGEIEGQLYLDMRLIKGTDLARLLKQFGALTPPRAVAIIRQVASALDAAHAAGVIHRDVKPENILITDDDFAYLVDFGIASAATDDSLTQAGSAVGTWKYAAPERFNDVELTHSIDIYALACVLHECLTGSPPYRADKAGLLMSAHLTAPIPHPSKLRPGIPGALDEVIERGMAKEPQDRYPRAGDLALAAHAALSISDQDREDRILEHSQRSVLPESQPLRTRSLPPPPSPPAPHPPAPGSYPRHGGSGPSPGLAPAGTAGGWPGQHRLPAPQHRMPTPGAVFPHRPAPRRRKPMLLLGAAAVVLVGVLIGLIIWPRHPSDPAPSTIPISTPTAAESQTRLFGLLPRGYPAGACKPTATPKNALAEVSCGKNSDPGGPPSATYTLFEDATALSGAFDRLVQSTSIEHCPGAIQSPGPWHRKPTPQEVSGTLMCGLQQGHPVVAWTNDAELLVGVIHADPQARGLDELYEWWMFHS